MNPSKKTQSCMNWNLPSWHWWNSLAYTNTANGIGGTSLHQYRHFDGGNKHMNDGWMHGGGMAWGISPMEVAEPHAWRTRSSCWRDTLTHSSCWRDTLKKRIPSKKSLQTDPLKKKVWKTILLRYFAQVCTSLVQFPSISSSCTK